MEIVGIDPGTAPTICRLYAENGKPLTVDFWDERETADLIRINGKERRECSVMMMFEIFQQVTPAAVFLESVNAHPGEGVVSAFRFGRAVGICEAAALAAGHPVQTVRPQTWRKLLRVPEGKDGARYAASTIAPHLAKYFKLVKDHNKADAFLIALYGYRELASRIGEPA